MTRSLCTIRVNNGCISSTYLTLLCSVSYSERQALAEASLNQVRSKSCCKVSSTTLLSEISYYEDINMIEEVVIILQKSDSEYQQIGFLILRKIESYEIELKVDSKHPNAESLKEIVLNSNINREFSNGNELKRLEIWKSINFNLVSEGYVLENVSNLHPSVKVALQIREPDFIVDQKQQDCSIEIAREIYNLAKNGLSKPVLEIIQKINIEINLSNYNNAFLVLEEAYDWLTDKSGKQKAQTQCP